MYGILTLKNFRAEFLHATEIVKCFNAFGTFPLENHSFKFIFPFFYYLLLFETISDLLDVVLALSSKSF